MAEYTEHYLLYKPSRDDTTLEVDTTLANNFTTIDTTMNNLQSQISQVVVSGDSSPQATLASVGADGTEYGGNLKVRLDTEYNHQESEIEFLKSQFESLGTISPKWAGKTIMTFGDSITYYDGKTFGASHTESGQNVIGYQSYMRTKLGCTVVNNGQNGYRMPQILPVIRGTSFTEVDAVTLTAGANDFRYVGTEPIGTLGAIGSAFDETTFYGSFQAAIEYILSVKPEMKIYLLTPVRGWSDADGLMSEAYPNAILEIAKLYSLSCCDWYHESGINTLNKSVYIGDTSAVAYDLHPTNKGFERMANILIPFLSNH